MGHEFCGEVFELGPDVASFRVGDRVVANAIVHCGACRFCDLGLTHLCDGRQVFGMHRPGAFAEYVAVPERVLLAWPPGLDARSACLAEPLANGVHVLSLVKDRPADSAVVIGAGPIGLSVLQALRALRSSAVMVCDLNADRARLAEKLGATSAHTEAEDLLRQLREVGGGGADLVIDAVGTGATKRLALECTRVGGTCVWLGLGEDGADIPTYEVTLGERCVMGSYGATMEELRVAIALMGDRSVDMSSWTSEYAIDDGVDAFMAMASAKGNDVKVILRPGGDP